MLFSTDRTADASPGWSNNSTSVYARGHSRCSPSTRRAVTEKASSPTHFWLARNKRMCISTDINSSSSHPSSSEVYKEDIPTPRWKAPVSSAGRGAGNQEHRDLWLHQSWAGLGEGDTNQKNPNTYLRSKKVSRKKAQS